ncbi:NAD-dependent epimerase/dehydratase family protein [bacterium]|nr:NAD-dependent epimerase/dehydratase family protein [bacterium]
MSKTVETVLITGSGGFVGGNLKKYLKDKYNLLTPRSFELDCTDEHGVSKYFDQNKIDFVIHCGTVGGARGLEDKDTTVEDNLKMVENILSAKRDDTRVILFGSGAMYGKSQNLHKVNEKSIGDFLPLDLYGKSKMLIAEKIRNCSDVLCLNIFACYGYNEKSSRFPTYAITQNLKHEKIEINQNVVFDYLFVDDLCRIVEYFILNQPKNNILNVTPEKSVSLLEIANIVNEISGFKSEITIKTDTLGHEYTGDNSNLLKEIKGFNFTTIEQGLKALYMYISEQNFICKNR